MYWQRQPWLNIDDVPVEEYPESTNVNCRKVGVFLLFWWAVVATGFAVLA